MVLRIFRGHFAHFIAIGKKARALRGVLEVAVQLAYRREIRMFAFRLCAHALPSFRAVPPSLQLSLVFHARANGLLQSLSEIPQYAIAQVWSFSSAPLNPSIAWPNWKECSSATARLKSLCAALLHEVGRS